MLARRILCAALATAFLLAVVIPVTEGGKMKKLIAASVLIHALKPRFKPIPIPVPFKIKIGEKKGEKYMPYPVQSDYGMMGGGYGGGMMGGYGGGMMGMGGYD